MSFSGIHVRCYSQVSCAVPCTMLHREEEWGLRSAVCSAIITIMPSAEAATYMVTRCTVNTRYTRYTRYSDHFCCKNIPARCNLHCIFPCPLSSFWRVSAGCEMPVSISLRDVIVRGPRFWHQYFENFYICLNACPQFDFFHEVCSQCWGSKNVQVVSFHCH